MKLVVIGTDKFAIRLAEAALDEGLPPSAFVSMPASALPLNSADIRGFSATHNIPLFEFEDLNAAEALTAFRVLAPDYVLCSWPRMLGKDFLGIPKKFVIGTHPDGVAIQSRAPSAALAHCPRDISHQAQLFPHG